MNEKRTVTMPGDVGDVVRVCYLSSDPVLVVAQRIPLAVLQVHDICHLGEI